MTPQRTLHGKRHIRARASVQIGRDKKRVRKFNRTIKYLAYTIGQLSVVMSDAFRNIGDAVVSLVERINALKVEDG